MLLPIPALAALVVIASTIKQTLTVEVVPLIIASLAWMYPTRTIWSQTLTMRERAYVEVARLSGTNALQLPPGAGLESGPVPSRDICERRRSLGASVAGIRGAGAGTQNESTLGMTIFWSIQYGALLRGMWRRGGPVTLIVLLFTGLFLVPAGFDGIANPRLRRTI